MCWRERKRGWGGRWRRCFRRCGSSCPSMSAGGSRRSSHIWKDSAMPIFVWKWGLGDPGSLRLSPSSSSWPHFLLKTYWISTWGS
jgi:hypothetical protein